MSKNVKVTDVDEKLAVMDGKLEGDVYADGEVWADSEALAEWRGDKAMDQPHRGHDDES